MGIRSSLKAVQKGGEGQRASQLQQGGYRQARHHSGTDEHRIARGRVALLAVCEAKEALGLLEQLVALRIGLARVLIGDELAHKGVERLPQLDARLQRLGDAVDRREGARDKGEGRGEGDGAAVEERPKLEIDLLRDTARDSNARPSAGCSKAKGRRCGWDA